MKDNISIYLNNRLEFYRTLLPRIPLEAFRERLGTAATPVEPDDALVQTVQNMPEVCTENLFLATLLLSDVLKKATFGRAFGRTVISVEEALSRAEHVEETGLLFFEALAAEYTSFRDALAPEIQRRRAALSAVLILADELRYHKIKLIPGSGPGADRP